MLIDLGNNNSVDTHEIESIYTESPSSDADFMYHDKVYVKTKSGTVLETIISESELRKLVSELSPTATVLDRETPYPVELGLDPKSNIKTRDKDEDVRDTPDAITRQDFEDLIKTQKALVQELGTLREFFHRFLCLVEDGKIGITLNN